MAERPIAARVGLVGIAGGGKTSLFCALTGADYSQAVASTGKTVAATVRVVDPRLTKMHEVEGPQKKLVAPLLEIVDAPSIALEGPDKDGNAARLSGVRECDGFVVVLKAYEGEDAQKQFDSLRSELIVADMVIMENRIERLKSDTKRALPNRDELVKELAVLEPLLEAVGGGDAKAFGKLTAEDEKRLKGFQFYSKKPLVPLANIAETGIGKACPVTAVPVKLEMELLSMEGEERAAFMKDYGLEKLVLESLAVDLYDKMQMQTFITTGDKDVTGWHLRKGGTALEAAGRIHTDLAKGFINCEVVSFEEWGKWKNYHEAKSRAPKRAEGKAYVMKDYDIVNIKFNV